MAYHGVVIPSKVAAMNVDSMNRPAVSASAIDNGNIFYFSGKSATAGESEVWTAVVPATAHLYDLWMAYEPEVVVTNAQYKGLDPDIRNFYNAIGDVFSAYQPQIGDLIMLTDEALTGSSATGDYVVATDADFKLNWAAAAVSGLSYKLAETTYISLATGAINTQRTTAYLFECVAVA
jgi:hypothetical protein